MFNHIRSGVFEKVNDRGGGGWAVKAPTISKTVLPIVTVHSTRCFVHDPVRIFQNICDFDHFTAISK